MHSEHKSKAKPQSYAPRVCGIQKYANNTRRRRVSGWVMKKSQKGAWPQKLVLPAKAARACFRRFFAAPTPSAALASQLGKFPQSEKTSQLDKFPRAKRQPATRASSPRSNASPPTWNASPSLSPTKQPESQVFKPPESRTRPQPICSLTLQVLHRKFTGHHCFYLLKVLLASVG